MKTKFKIGLIISVSVLCFLILLLLLILRTYIPSYIFLLAGACFLISIPFSSGFKKIRKRKFFLAILILIFAGFMFNFTAVATNEWKMPVFIESLNNTFQDGASYTYSNNKTQINNFFLVDRIS